MRVLERTASVGGRMARAELPDGRLVEWGASYLTADGIEDHVSRWLARGLLEPWTDTFAVAGPEGLRGWARGPMRYRAPQGLRSLARELADGLEIEFGVTVDSVERGMVLALPRPQAAALHPAFGGQPWEAVTVTLAVFDVAPTVEAVFVHDTPDLERVINHGGGALALYEPGRPTPWPDDAPPPSGRAVEAARAILDLPAPTWTRTRTWRLAQPAAPEPRPFGIADGIAAVGDGWSTRPRIGAAIASGEALAEHLIRNSFATL